MAEDYQWLIDAILKSGGPTQVTRDYNPKAAGTYYGGENLININPPAAPNAQPFEKVAKHEIGHALQDRVIGMQPTSPTDIAIRQRLKLPQNDPGMQRSINENLAQFIGNPREPLDTSPLLQMVMRELANQIFRTLATGGKLANPPR